MRLLLVRHAESAGNAAGALESVAPGSELTHLGHVQAWRLATALDRQSVDGIFCSPAVRALDTARVVARLLGIPVRVLPGLLEISAGVLEGRRDDEAVHEYTAMLMAWASGDLAPTVMGGESGDHFRRRYLEALGVIQMDIRGVGMAVAVTHGGAMRVFSGLGLSGSGGSALGPFENTGYLELDSAPAGGWTCRRLVRSGNWGGRNGLSMRERG